MILIILLRKSELGPTLFPIKGRAPEAPTPSNLVFADMADTSRLKLKNFQDFSIVVKYFSEIEIICTQNTLSFYAISRH